MHDFKIGNPFRRVDSFLIFQGEMNRVRTRLCLQVETRKLNYHDVGVPSVTIVFSISFVFS